MVCRNLYKEIEILRTKKGQKKVKKKKEEHTCPNLAAVSRSLSSLSSADWFWRTTAQSGRAQQQQGSD